MRNIIRDEKDMQVQVDDNGTEYHYEKIYVPTGDRKTEYCLSLVRTENTVRGESLKTYVGVKDVMAKHFIIIRWPGVSGKG